MGSSNQNTNEFKPCENFKYLDDLIHSGVKRIVLDSDIILGYKEEMEYGNGIYLDVDDLVIDGNGHSIDAKGKSRIFYCMGENVTLKNLTLKNGFKKSDGGAIYNSSGDLTIIHSTLAYNASNDNGGAIFNNSSLTIWDVRFEKNSAASSDDIHNNRRLIIKGNFSSDHRKTIINNDCTIIEYGDYNEDIENSGRIIEVDILKEGQMGFKDLKRLIQSEDGEIKLENDVMLNIKKNEDKIFKNGIKINRDNLVIDGAGHTIDAQNLARIFNCNAKNVTLKNVILKNGFSSEDGGAIANNGELTIIESTFAENHVKGYFSDYPSDWGVAKGGAIANKGELTIIESSFNNNTTGRGGGGAVHNDATLNISSSVFSNNAVEVGGGGAIDNNAMLNISSSVFSNNAAERGGAISTEGELTIMESSFSNNSAGRGGAIANYEKILNIANSTFNKNVAKWGGAIFNDKGSININESELLENMAEKYGGAIVNSDGSNMSETAVDNTSARWIKGGTSTITESIISKNTAKLKGGALYNKGETKVFNSKFSDNESPDGTINNLDSLQVNDCIFTGNHGKNIIVNVGELSNIDIFNVEFKDNVIDESIILNDGKSASMERVVFENNLSKNVSKNPIEGIFRKLSGHNNGSKNIINHSDLILTNPKIKDEGKTILNEGNIIIKKSGPDFLKKIYGKGKIEDRGIPKTEKFDFGYLDKKIHESNVTEIVLDHDICLEDYERDFYEGGIELDIDNLIIDGNGHYIDGADRSRIFTVTGNNITLKNMTFKNGHSHKTYNNILNNPGGALRIIGNIELIIENCKFLNNVSEADGGAISNRGILSVFESTFEENIAKNDAGTINNLNGKLTLTECIFNKNGADVDGGAIMNGRKSTLAIIESKFIENKAGELGGAILNTKMGEITISLSSFEKNNANHGGAIYNGRDCRLNVDVSRFGENESNFFGGAIHSSAILTLNQSTFIKNKAGKLGGAINSHRGELTKNDCSFYDNRPDQVNIDRMIV